jgi:hypothetical protein
MELGLNGAVSGLGCRQHVRLGHILLNQTIRTEESLMNHQELEMQQQGDSLADALTALVLIAVFVSTCIFWVSGQ